MQHEVPEEKGIIVSSWKYFFSLILQARSWLICASIRKRTEF